MGSRAADSRTIVFTDSRDEAARTAVGVERNHFRDLVRQLVRRHLTAPTLDRVDILTRGGTGDPALDDAEQAILDEITRQDPGLVRAHMRRGLGAATVPDLERIEAFELVEKARGSSLSWPTVLHRVSTDLVALGVNPGGPKASMADLSVGRDEPWFRVYPPPTPDLWIPLPADSSPWTSIASVSRLPESLPEPSSTERAETSSRLAWDGWMQPI